MTPFPRKQLCALFAKIINVPGVYSTWKGAPEPSYMKPADPLVWGSLRVDTSSRVAVGADDLRYIDDGDGTFTVRATGRRRAVLSIDCFTWDSADNGVDASDLLSLLETRIYQPGNLDSLNGMSLVVVSNEAVVALPTTINSRYISAAHIDITIALANVDDGAIMPGGNQWIGEVQGTGNQPLTDFDVKGD